MNCGVLQALKGRSFFAILGFVRIIYVLNLNPAGNSSSAKQESILMVTGGRYIRMSCLSLISTHIVLVLEVGMVRICVHARNTGIIALNSEQLIK